MELTEDRAPATLGTAGIVFFVLAAISPLGAAVAIVPISIARGNGIGITGTYLIAGAVLGLFGVAYVRMSRHMPLVGAFSVYATKGFGRNTGAATAYVAVLAYNMATIGIFGTVAYFAHVLCRDGFGVDLPWQLCAAVIFALLGALTWRDLTLSKRILGVALVVEMAVMLVFDLLVLSKAGFAGFSLKVLSPRYVLNAKAGVGLMMAFGSFVGFEATAIYSERATNPRRSIPRATYSAVTIITVFYVLTTWAIIASYGTAHIGRAASHHTATLVFDAATRYGGKTLSDAMQLLVVTSLLAALVAFHQAATRYQTGLAVGGLLPRRLTATNRHGSPVVSSAVQLTLTAVVVIGFTLAHQQPYLRLGASTYGLGVLGIVLLQAIASFSVAAFFRRRPDRSFWTTFAAPLVAGGVLTAASFLLLAHYSVLTGTHVGWIDSMPLLLVAAALAGPIVVRVLKVRSPDAYELLALEDPAEAAA